MQKSARIRVHRQEGPGCAVFVQEFDVVLRENLTVAAALHAIAARPITIHGETVAPVVWDASGCGSQHCGSCLMLIGGKPRLACMTAVADLVWPVELSPLTKFRLLRDLLVDRAVLNEDLTRLGSGTALDLLFPERLSTLLPQVPSRQILAAELSRCTFCCACLEVCPSFAQDRFVGAAVLNRVRVDRGRDVDPQQAGKRLDSLMQPGGIAGCNLSGDCIKACPEKIPLTESIAQLNRDLTRHALRSFFG